MAKSADAFRSIGEVARLIGVAPHVLRYWETQFPQLSPVKRADGRRYYRPDDVRLAAGLCEVMREDGMTARGALRLMAEDKGEALRARGAERIALLLEREEQGDAPKPATRPSARPALRPERDRSLPLFPDGGADGRAAETGDDRAEVAASPATAEMDGAARAADGRATENSDDGAEAAAPPAPATADGASILPPQDASAVPPPVAAEAPPPADPAPASAEALTAAEHMARMDAALAGLRTLPPSAATAGPLRQAHEALADLLARRTADGSGPV